MVLVPLSASWPSPEFKHGHKTLAKHASHETESNKTKLIHTAVLLKSPKEGEPAGPDGPCRGNLVLAVEFTP